MFDCSRLIEQSKSIWPHLVSVTLLIATIGTVATIDPDLQNKVFEDAKSNATNISSSTSNSSLVSSGDQSDGVYRIVGILGGINGFVVLVVAPVAGAVSDRFGRARPLIFLFACVCVSPLVCLLTGYNYRLYYYMRAAVNLYGAAFSIIMACVVDIYRADRVSLTVSNRSQKGDESLLENLVSIQSVDRAAVQHSASSHANDAASGVASSSNEVEGDRTEVFSILIVFFALGVAVGSVVGVSLYDRTADGAKSVIVLQLVLSLIALAWIIFLSVWWPALFRSARQQDSNSDGADESSAGADATTYQAVNSEQRPILATPLQLAQQQEKQRQSTLEMLCILLRNRGVMISSAVVFLDFLCEQSLQNVLTLYFKKQLKFTNVQIEAFLLVLVVMVVLGNVVLVRYLRSMSVMTLMRTSLCANAALVAIYSVVQTPWQAFLPLVGIPFGCLVFPSMTTVSSLFADDSMAGTAQGIVASARFIAEGVSPALFGIWLQDAKGTSFPGSPFLGAAGCVACALALTFLLPPLPKK